MKVDNNPLFLVLSWDDPGMRIKWEHCIDFNGSKYRLCGIIYWGHYHFTCRIVQKDGSVFYHDGIRTKDKCAFEGSISNMTARKLSTASGIPGIMALYVLQED